MSARVLGAMLAARFNAFQQNVDNWVSPAGEMIVALEFPVVKDPGGDDFVNGPKEAVRGDGDGEFLAEHARVLAFFKHALDEVKVLDHHVVGKLAEKFGAMPQFRLENNRQTAFGAQSFQL